MPRLTINGQAITVEPGTTVMEAAQLAGVTIPALCYLKGLPHFTSCMVCVVQERTSGRLLPSCRALANEGMVVETETDEVRQAREGSLNLLMSEHAGDCEAPCTTTCPAHLKIPLMIRQIAAGQTNKALATLYDTIALPAVLGRICPAPCEKACRRHHIDAPLSICLLERFAADEIPGPPLQAAPATTKHVAIIGAGPTGLATAFYLAQTGHDCTIFDDHPQPGGQLRYGVSDTVLPATVLDKEIQRLHQLGIHFRMSTHIGTDMTLQNLKAIYDAVVLAIGKTPPETLRVLGMETNSRGIKVDGHTFQTSDEQIFAGGEVVQAGHLTVRAVAHGKAIALSIDQLLKGLPVTGSIQRFESRLGRMTDGEHQELLKEADPAPRLHPSAGTNAGFTRDEAIRESRRCMHCDCRKAEACKLRDYMEFFKSGPMPIPAEGRKPIERNITHPKVIFEPGKCIKCGRCVRITTDAGEKPGLTFLKRGFDSTVGVPFGDTLEAALGSSAEKCVQACPTGALAWKNS